MGLVQCQKPEDIDPLQEISPESSQQVTSSVLSGDQLLQDPAFLKITEGFADIGNNELSLKSGEVNEKYIIKLNLDQVKKISKGEYLSFSFLIDNKESFSGFSNLLLETDGNIKKAYKIDYHIEPWKTLPAQKGQNNVAPEIYVTQLTPSDITLKTASCLTVRVYDEANYCPNPACNGEAGCIYGCNGVGQYTSYTVCFFGRGGSTTSSGTTYATPTENPSSSENGSHTGTTYPNQSADIYFHRQFYNELFGIELGDEAKIFIQDPEIYDLDNDIVKVGENIAYKKNGGFYFKDNGCWLYYYDGRCYLQMNVYDEVIWMDVGSGLDYFISVVESALKKPLTYLLKTFALITPIDGMVTLISGEDINGIEQNRYAAGAFLLLAVIPGSKILKPVANTLGDATKYFFKYGDELLGLIKTSGVVKFTDDAVLKLVKKATKNPTKTKVLLGKLDYEGTLSYVQRAGNEYKYFKFDGTGWTDLFGLIESNVDEMWKVNKKFIDDAYSKGDEIFLSHNPYDAKIRTGFYKMEIDYIEHILNGKIEKISNDLWKVTF